MGGVTGGGKGRKKKEQGWFATLVNLALTYGDIPGLEILWFFFFFTKLPGQKALLRSRVCMYYTYMHKIVLPQNHIF